MDFTYIYTSKIIKGGKMLNEEEKKYISYKIGEEYKSWKENDIILISSQTGSGKSHFILHKLLPYCIQKELKILYLVNRNILKEQLIEEIETVIENELDEYFIGTINSISNYIFITTYQSIENKILIERPQYISNFISKYDICIYDECHYFYSDALYNTYTELSFDFLRKNFDKKIQVFISATMYEIEKVILKRKPVYTRFSPYGKSNERFSIFNPCNIKKYYLENNYDYINLKILKDIEELKNIIQCNFLNKSEKWLIFIDSINAGKKLCKELEKNFQNKVVFIDADYRERDEAVQEIKEIVRNSKMTNQIIITTPVMDNGISIHDYNLKHIVIMYDTKEEFIQMLGRKRPDNSKLNLYILMRDKKHFQNRLIKIEQILELYKKHYKSISEMYTFKFNSIYSGHERIVLYPINCWEHSVPLNAYYQKNILKDILQPNRIDDYKKICYTFNGYIAFNSFSINKCKKLKSFYKDIIKRMEENNKAFAIEQQRWLGISDEIINLNVYNFEQEIRQKIKNSIEPILDKEFLGTDNKNFKSDIQDNLLILISNINNTSISQQDIKKYKRYLKDNERKLSDKTFNFIMEALDFPYRMIKPTGSSYKIISNEI